MNIVMTGATGFIGSTASRSLRSKGHRVIALSRSRSSVAEGEACWDPARGVMDLSKAQPINAVIHLAGESIARRWTPERKQAIYESRVRGTRFLCESLAAMTARPATVVCASAVGIYGNRGEELLDEQSASGGGFLAQVCRDWEAAADPARRAGIRVVHLRFGIVLARDGGALSKMLPIFRIGGGGRLGHGKQWWSWIAVDDVVRVVNRALEDEQWQGPINCVAPEAVTNREFTRALGAALHRPTLLPVPSFVVRLVLGEMGQETLLASARVRPVRLQESGFAFAHPQLETALDHVLNRA